MSHSGPSTAERSAAGQLRNGALVEAVTLSNAGGISARILTYGATLQSLVAPDRDGVLADIILGHDDVGGYENARGYLGVTIGRYANRIAGGRFMLDGVEYCLGQNDGANTLHGGAQGFDRALWTIDAVTMGVDASVRLRHVSRDGDGGFPGKVAATVTYTLDSAGDLAILFEAMTDRTTVLNITNHAVFNLADSGGSAMFHRLTIPATEFTPVDLQLIPTGALCPVDGTVFDFRNGRVIAEGLGEERDAQIAIAGGYDHNFVLDKGTTAEPQLAARLEESISGRRLDVLTTEPGVQFYSGNSLDGRLIGKRGRAYLRHEGVALEPQKFPDTPNRPDFGSARLDPGQTYRHAMIYRMTVMR